MSAIGGKADIKPTRPPASRCAITSPRAREPNFFGNSRRGKRGRANRADFSRGKVDRLVVVTEAAMRWKTLTRRFARAGSRESGYGPKENSLRLLSFLGFKAAFLQPGRTKVIYHYGRAFFVIVPVFS